MFPPTMRWRCAGNGRRYEEDEKRYVTPSLLQIFLKQDYSNGEYVSCWYCCYFWLHLFGGFGRSIPIFPDLYVSTVGGSMPSSHTSWWPNWSDRFVWCCPAVNSYVVGITCFTLFCDVYTLEDQRLEPTAITHEKKGTWSSKPPWLCSMLIFQGVPRNLGNDPILRKSR